MSAFQQERENWLHTQLEGWWLDRQVDFPQAKSIQKGKWNQVQMAHTCNPSYSGGRDQEDPSLKPALGK
jgi:hypothetical protein